MSNLIKTAARCPVMGPAMQTAKSRCMGVGSVAALRAFSGMGNTGRAKLHTSRPVEAKIEEVPFGGKRKNILIPGWQSSRQTS